MFQRGISSGSRGRIPLLLGLLLVAYLLSTLPLLTRYPAPWVDEGWIGEVAAQVSRGLAPGNPSHGTTYHFNDRLFWMPPAAFYLLGGWFSLFGVSLAAGRLLNVVTGAFTVAALFLFLRRRIGPAGAFIAGLLFCLDTFVWKAHRTIRFESLLALFAVLLAWLVMEALERDEAGRSSRGVWAGAGLAAGILLNVHPNGILFALGAAAVVIERRRGGAARGAGPWIALLVAGLAVLPYLLYCLGDAAAGFANLRGQNSFHLDSGHGEGPAFLREWKRYATFFPAPARLPAAAGLLLVLAAGLRSFRERTTRALLLMLLVPLAGMAFLPNKTLLYLVPAMPFAAALAGAWWHRSRSAGTAIVLAALIVSDLAVGTALLARNRDCRPERTYAAIRARLSPGDRVAGTFITWWGVQPLPFHEFSRGPTIESVDRFRPTVILLGDRQWASESRTRWAPLARAFQERFAARGLAAEAAFNDCPGSVEFFRVAPPASAPDGIRP